MKVKNPEILQQNKNLEPSKIALDYIFFNHVKHALKKKHVYVSKYSTVGLHNTQCYSLDVLFGSKFLRKLRINLSGKTGFNKSKFNRVNKRFDKVVPDSRIQPRVLKLKKKKSLLYLKIKTSLILYKKKRKEGLIKKNTVLKKILFHFPEYKKRLSYFGEKPEINLINDLLHWLRLGLKSTISGSSLYRYRTPDFFSKYQRTSLLKNSSFFNKHIVNIDKTISSSSSKIAPLTFDLYGHFYKKFIFLVKNSHEKRKKLELKAKLKLSKKKINPASLKKASSKKILPKKLPRGKALSTKTKSNILNLNIFDNTEKNIYFNLNPINNKVYKPIYREFFNEFSMFKYNLFPRNSLFYLDFVAMVSLLARKDISLEVFGNALSSILSSIHKRKHGTFISLLTTLSKKVVETKDSLISGMRFLFSGRVFGNSMAKSSLIGAGSLELNTIDAHTDHAAIDSFTVYGVFGIQIWVTYKPKTPIEDFPDYELIRKQKELMEDGKVKESSSIRKESKVKKASFSNKRSFLRYLILDEGVDDDPLQDIRKKPRRSRPDKETDFQQTSKKESKTQPNSFRMKEDTKTFNKKPASDLKKSKNKENKKVNKVIK